MFWKKKFNQIEVEPDPKDIFDPMKELLETKDEIINHLKEENRLLKDENIHLRAQALAPKVQREVPNAVQRFMPFSEVRKIVEQAARERAAKRHNEKITN